MPDPERRYAVPVFTRAARTPPLCATVSAVRTPLSPAQDPCDCLRHPLFAGVPASMSDADPAPLLAWAGDSLAERGCTVTGGPTSHRNRHWSTVLRIPTTRGPVWVKANAAGFAHEAALLALLSERAPGTVLDPYAVDAERGWLVTPDGGPTLREQPSNDPAQTWGALLTRYAGIQQRLAPLSDPAARVGTPDFRGRLILDALAPAAAAAAAHTHAGHRLTPGEVRNVLALRPQLTELADELAASPVPSSVEHNDPHPGNVFATSGRLFDFADAVVGHPFLGLASALPDAAADLGVAVAGAEIDAMRESYLVLFSDFASLEQLRRSAAVAAVLVHLPRAATWLRVVPAGRSLWPAALPDRMRALLRGAATLRA